jgi:hypothetical protein
MTVVFGRSGHVLPELRQSSAAFGRLRNSPETCVPTAHGTSIVPAGF